MSSGIVPEIEPPRPSFLPEGGRWTVRWGVPEFPDVEAWLTGGRVGSDAPAPPPVAASLVQVHGTHVEIVTAPGVSPACDASVTRARGLALTVQVADCVPVFIVGPNGLGLAHAGWRGAIGGIVGRTVTTLAESTGDAPARLRAWIGPSIGPCCFEVSPDVAERFPPEHRLAGRLFPASGANPHVDLWGACRGFLISAGVPPLQVAVAGVCTRCHQHLLRSYRGSAGSPGRNEAWLRRRMEPGR